MSPAQIILPGIHDEPHLIVNQLHLTPYRAVMLLFGGASGMDTNHANALAQIIEEAIVPYTVEQQMVLIDGGTDSGIMRLVGQAVGKTPHPPTLLGVAPYQLVRKESLNLPTSEVGSDSDDLVPLEPHHSHFVLPPGNEWGSETSMMIAIAAELSRKGEGCPVVAMIANGGMIAMQEVHACVGRGWPVIVLSGTGRTADRIADALAKSTNQRELETHPISPDPILNTIIEQGRLFPLPVTSETSSFQQLLNSIVTQN